jgi:hypothetical protein
MPADDAPRTSPKAAPADHDHGYKLLFAHAEMVRDLLVGFVDEPWVNELQFDTPQRVSAGYVSDDPRDREGDVCWMKAPLTKPPPWP